MDKAFLRINEVKNIVGFSTAWIYQLIHEREIPACRIGRTIFIPKAEFEEWLSRKHQEAREKSPLEPRQIKRDPKASGRASNPRPNSPLEGQEAFELRNALLKAVEIIRIWHDANQTYEKPSEEAWRIYFNHAPEMQEIRAALERHA